MAGARIGYALLSECNAAVFQKIRLQYGVNRNAQIGALASLSDQRFHRWVLQQTAAAREDYYALARRLGCGYIESRTNFVCIDFENAARATDVVARLLERGVWIRKPGAPPLDRYVRVSAGTQPMRQAFARALSESIAFA
jgi:histidinol-phosphate aminotransferase